jgi:hypothetical protein
MGHLAGESVLAATISAEEVEKMFRNEPLLGEVGRRGETPRRTARGTLIHGPNFGGRTNSSTTSQPISIQSLNNLQRFLKDRGLSVRKMDVLPWSKDECDFDADPILIPRWSMNDRVNPWVGNVDSID